MHHSVIRLEFKDLHQIFIISNVRSSDAADIHKNFEQHRRWCLYYLLRFGFKVGSDLDVKERKPRHAVVFWGYLSVEWILILISECGAFQNWKHPTFVYAAFGRHTEEQHFLAVPKLLRFSCFWQNCHFSLHSIPGILLDGKLCELLSGKSRWKFCKRFHFCFRHSKVSAHKVVTRFFAILFLNFLPQAWSFIKTTLFWSCFF